MKPTLEQVLKLLPLIKYRVVIHSKLADALGVPYSEVDATRLKEYLKYQVIAIERDFTVVIEIKNV